MASSGLVPRRAQSRPWAINRRARAAVTRHGVPLVPGTEAGMPDDELLQAATGIGFPVLIKAVAGGGGKGMRPVEREEDFAEALATARREAEAPLAMVMYMSRSCCRARGISNFRFWRTRTAIRYTWASVNARFSVDIRNLLRKRRASSSTATCAKQWARWRLPRPNPSATSTPARLNAWSTKTRTTTFWR